MSRYLCLVIVLPAVAACGSADLDPVEAAQGAVDVLCSFPDAACPDTILPDDSLQVLADSLVIRREGEDVRHIDLRKSHIATFYRSNDGWEPRMSEDLKEAAEDYQHEKKAALRLARQALANIETSQLLYKLENGQYSKTRYGLNYSEPSSVITEILGAGEDWWVARSIKYPVECIQFRGTLPQEFDSLIGAFDADEVLGGCIP